MNETRAYALLAGYVDDPDVEQDFEEVIEAATFLRDRPAILGTMPGRYARTVEALLAEVDEDDG